MKFNVYMKTPDAIEYAIKDALEEEFGENDREDEECRIKIWERENELKELLEQWFQYGECVTIQIDTETKTATVLEA